MRNLLARGSMVLLWATMILLPERIFAQTPREYDVKAVFLFNFAQFVEWPDESLPSLETPIVIGILGTDPFGGVLDDVVQNEKVRGHKVKVERYQRPEEVQQCHILFIGDSEWRRVPRILSNLKGRPVLTVSEAETFARQGGMIRFYTEKEKVRLLINHEAARAARLVISSKLLRVSTVVKTYTE